MFNISLSTVNFRKIYRQSLSILNENKRQSSEKANVIENANMASKWPEEADEFKSKNITNYYNIDLVASQTIRKFQIRVIKPGEPRDD
jgi:ABC-type uncharacterized transport system ATPase subunit